VLLLLLIHVPNTYVPERSYIIQTLLHNFLGINSEIIIQERNDVLIKENSNADGRILRVADILFQTPETQWLTQTSLPKQPLPIWDTTKTCPNVSLVSFKLPIMYGNKVSSNGLNEDYLVKTPEGLYLGLDIFGSAFFMLTRYEELVKPDRDQHDRFPATASLAYQEGFLDRPIINEYIEILWHCMKHLWPGLERKQRAFKVIVSHDVDVPFAQAFTGIPRLIRNCGGDIIRRKSFAMAINRFSSWQAIKKGNYKQDFNYTFDRIMDISEQHNLTSAFYFKTACTNRTFDDNYSIDHPYIRQLMREIHNRGHEIGLHPSYETYQNPEQTKAEFNKLLQVCDEEGIQQKNWGGRQHFLRWQVPVTWRNWNEAGLIYDSTLSYADQAGFRCGICYEFPIFDLEKHQVLPLRERPLIVMEVSVVGEQYMNLSSQEALSRMLMLKERCQQFNGNFCLLWHNSSLIESHTEFVYKSMLST
jgi:hypothetical protein